MIKTILSIAIPSAIIVGIITFVIIRKVKENKGLRLLSALYLLSLTVVFMEKDEKGELTDKAFQAFTKLSYDIQNSKKLQLNLGKKLIDMLQKNNGDMEDIALKHFEFMSA